MVSFDIRADKGEYIPNDGIRALACANPQLKDVTFCNNYFIPDEASNYEGLKAFAENCKEIKSFKFLYCKSNIQPLSMLPKLQHLYLENPLIKIVVLKDILTNCQLHALSFKQRNHFTVKCFTRSHLVACKEVLNSIFPIKTKEMVNLQYILEAICSNKVTDVKVELINQIKKKLR